MKLALFNGNRLGVVREGYIYDATMALPHWDNDFAANWWVRMCKDFVRLRPAIEAAIVGIPGLPLSSVKLNTPALHPQKIIAVASNYAAHIQEMRNRATYEEWLLQFGIFLKAPSSIIGPGDTIELPEVGDAEIHHESELGVIIGRIGKNISEEHALDYVLGYTGVLDITVRGSGDRSSRKSYDGFTPIGPWLVTADELVDPHCLRIKLWLNGQEEAARQDVYSGDMLVKIPAIISYASHIMTLNPGDVITTGAPPGVGKIVSGDVITFSIESIGRMHIYVR